MSTEYFDRQTLSYLINFVSAYEGRPKLLEKFMVSIDDETIAGVQVDVSYEKPTFELSPNDQDANEKFSVYIDGDKPEDKWEFGKYKKTLTTLRDRISDEIEVPASIQNLKLIASPPHDF